MNPHISFAALVIGLVTLGGPVGAQTQRSGGGESQKIMQQYQQLAAEKTSLQSQLAQMKKDLDGRQDRTRGGQEGSRCFEGPIRRRGWRRGPACASGCFAAERGKKAWSKTSKKPRNWWTASRTPLER